MNLSIEIACPLEEQAALVMRWRNDPETLTNSFHREPKVWESFWPEFTRNYFSDPELPPVFVKDDERRIAFLRFKRISHPMGSERQCCDISISVDPAKRGLGYGVGSLKLVTEFLRSRKVNDTLAEIRVENLASITAFKKAGYILLDQTIKAVEDTGEKCSIYRYLCNVTPKAARGLLIDLDGTLADSIGIVKSVYHDFLAQFGARGTDVEFNSLNGPPLDQVVTILKTNHNLVDATPELLTYYMKLVREQYLEAKPNPGAADILTHAKDRGWTCAVVTSNSEILAREWLTRHHLLEMISDIVGSESIRIGKPNPEPYLMALRRVGCEAEASLAIEDSVVGITSASGARIRTFAYVPRHHHMPTTLPNKCSIIRNLIDLKPWLSYA